MKINQDILAILSDCTIENNVIKINSGQLERKVYEEVNKILTAIGGKWDRRMKGHVFQEDPTASFEQIMLTEEVLPPQKFGQFYTPQKLVDEMIIMADLKPGMKVLEPSAGIGNIAVPVKNIVGRDNLTAYEIDGKSFNTLRMKGINVTRIDFLDVVPDPIYDRVLMNPPFELQQDIDHVCHAFKFLNPTGRLVSIMSPGFTFRQNAKSVAFKSFVNDRGEWIANLQGSFKESGTMINTITVTLDADTGNIQPPTFERAIIFHTENGKPSKIKPEQEKELLQNRMF